MIGMSGRRYYHQENRGGQKNRSTYDEMDNKPNGLKVVGQIVKLKK
jgi:hypothetical protein